ncbi:uncharacterized protein HMPREF1541_07891 [Cyphellophora europaea CBS 101466]|uniref:3-oxoacyl-[acyl-carrier-protein] reductase n=1 Tax=Cyphellophora europaea (strain CBS 101466) TaxID=1220924 RepID=W2RMG7_CYPE1|nr:uncharacterized protein HMPREF1541_07891 [Cyphellophora europaea CBS 101466]ETN36904.1 hypothetical protein HMPREF1541_07891 [Cyphellophora europaea CBS 101466]
MGRLDGKVAIITGGGQGFGKGIVEKFLAEGAKVVIADFVEAVGGKTAKDLGCEFHLTDVTKGDQWEACLKKTLDAYGKIDIVINNAGTTYRNQSNGDTTEKEYDMVMNVNVKSIFFSVQKIVPQMQKQGNGGVFVNIASTAGIRPRPGLIWYNASKAAVINATKCLAVEYAKDNIRMLSVCPVVGMGTGLTDLFLGKPENEKVFMSTVPLGRGTKPSDVANTCAFLASDEASFLTGNAVEVDGGRCV